LRDTHTHKTPEVSNDQIQLKESKHAHKHFTDLLVWPWLQFALIQLREMKTTQPHRT